MPIRTVRVTPEQREELIELCRQYSDLQKKAVEIRWALNNQVAALARLVESGEVAGLSKDFTQIEVVSAEEWKEALLNVATSERWVCTGFGPHSTARAWYGIREVQVDDGLPLPLKTLAGDSIHAALADRRRGSLMEF